MDTPSIPKLSVYRKNRNAQLSNWLNSPPLCACGCGKKVRSTKYNFKPSRRPKYFHRHNWVAMQRWIAEHPDHLKGLVAVTHSERASKKRSESLLRFYASPAGCKLKKKLGRIASRRERRRLKEDPALPFRRGKKISAALRQYFSSPEARQRQSERITRVHIERPDLAAMHSKRMKEKYKNSEFRRAWVISHQQCPNGSELLMMRALEALGFSYDFQFSVGPYFVDFRLKGSSLLVEVDGFWHFTDTVARNDRKRDRFLTGRGFSVIRVPSRMANCEHLREIHDAITSAVCSAKPTVVFVTSVQRPRRVQL